jgi:2-C-methyl-D-erythritol 2,4-cyclodiphosphate synthase
MLGGVQLEWPKGPKGHSDGDVILHAVIDALLGAAGLGDIGEWFPPSDDTYKGADSSDLLQRTLRCLENENWRIHNIDVTVMLEAPKLSAYKERIRDHLVTLADLQLNQVNIKAKTMEGLGPIGEGDAVAAMVTVLIEQKREAP